MNESKAVPLSLRSPFLNYQVRAELRDLFPKNMEVGVGVESNSTMEKTGEQYLDHVNKVNVNSDKPCGQHTPLIDCDKVTSTLQPSSPEHQDNFKLRDILQNIWLALLKVVKVMKNKDSLRNYHNPEEAKDTGWLHIMWHPEWDLKTEKGN